MMALRRFGNRAHRERVKTPRKAKVLKASTPEYWDRLLTRNGLSMERGHAKWLSYGHKLSDLDFDGVRTYATAKTEN